MTMLQLWADKKDVIEDTVDLLGRLIQDQSISWITIRNVHDVVSEFYGIDLRQLDRERRELLVIK
jgi:hypothetical protein